MFRIKTYKYYADNNRTSACQSPFKRCFHPFVAGTENDVPIIIADIYWNIVFPPLFFGMNTFIYLYVCNKDVCARESSFKKVSPKVTPGTHALEIFKYNESSDIGLLL